MKSMYRVGLALGLVAGVAAAQNPTAAQPKAAQPKVVQPKAQGDSSQAGLMRKKMAMAQMGQGGQMGPNGLMRAKMNRDQLEAQLRNRIGNQLKKGLSLSDDQFSKLQATNKKFEERRHLLVEQERDARMAMRDLMISGDTTNGAKVSASLDKALQIQRQRFDILEQEQKEMAGYLSPMQRAKFLGMQEQMFRRVEAMRAQAAGRRGPGGPGMRPGMGQGMGQGMGGGMMRPGMRQGMGQGMGQPGMRQPGIRQPGMGRMRVQQPPMRGMQMGPNGPPNGPPNPQQPPMVKPPVEEIVP